MINLATGITAGAHVTKHMNTFNKDAYNKMKFNISHSLKEELKSMKLIFLTLIAGIALSPLSAKKQKKITFDEMTAENVVYDKSNENVVTITPDSTSASHFYATIRDDEFTRQIRFYSTIDKIRLKKLNDLEKEEKILKDGSYFSQFKKNKSQSFFCMGKQEGEKLSFRDDTLFSVSLYRDNKLQKEEIFYPSGELKATILLNYLSEDDIQENVSEYYPGGQLKREELYKQNLQILEQRHYTSDGRDTTFALPFQRMPEYTGGSMALMQYLKENIVYPVSALRAKVSGRVVLKFHVEKDGSIGKVSVLQSLSKETDQEAIRVTKNMPRWTPGIQYGEPVVVFYTLPIVFALNANRR